MLFFKNFFVQKFLKNNIFFIKYFLCVFLLLFVFFVFFCFLCTKNKTTNINNNNTSNNHDATYIIQNETQVSQKIIKNTAPRAPMDERRVVK